MSNLIERNKQFQRDLFAGPFRGHGIVVDPVWPDAGELGDFACSDRPVREWLPWAEARYEAMLRKTEALEDDGVPCVGLNTNTGIFAAAFGCRLHVYDDMPTNACALPVVSTPDEADALAGPDMYASATLSRIMELGVLVRDRLGPDVPIGVPDIQSPFDIAALIWKKEDMLMALYDTPDAVERLVAKCARLLIGFLETFRTEFPNCNMSHCPGGTWGPADLGCWLSEDEVGCLSEAMFEAFCLPTLEEMSRVFGGMFMHCCAAADHQYENFLRVPDLRGLNRVFQHPPGPEPAVEAFSGHAVLIQAWMGEKEAQEYLDMARPDTRYFLNFGGMPIEDAKPLLERMRKRCGREA